jgi:dTMP kinase
LADRYVYTAYARDIVRGCDPLWIRKVYDFALKPDITFYFRVPVDVAAGRILSGRPKLKYYEAGMDLNLSNDIYESYRIFQSRIIEQYEKMATTENFTVIDGTLNIEQQQKMVREKFNNTIPGEIVK